MSLLPTWERIKELEQQLREAQQAYGDLAIEVERLEEQVRTLAHLYHESFHIDEDGEDFTDCGEKECLASCEVLGIFPVSAFPERTEP